MQREWSAEELIGSWTLVDEDWRLVSNKSGPTRLGFVISSPLWGVSDVALQALELRRGHVILSGVYDAPEAMSLT